MNPTGFNYFDMVEAINKEINESAAIQVAQNNQLAFYQASKRAYELAKLVDDKLSEEAKTDWRWRILYIRARIDLLIYTYYDEKGRYEEDGLAQLRRSKEEWLADDEEAQDLLQELCAHYHCVSENGENKWTRPRVKGGIVIPRK